MQIIRCDNCGRESRNPDSVGWRRLTYTSKFVRDETDDGQHDFCSWACAGEYATKKAATKA